MHARDNNKGQEMNTAIPTGAASRRLRMVDFAAYLLMVFGMGLAVSVALAAMSGIFSVVKRFTGRQRLRDNPVGRRPLTVRINRVDTASR
jgi:hypothetical protein